MRSTLLLGGFLVACGSGGGEPLVPDARPAADARLPDAPPDDPELQDPIVDLRADVDRDGVVEIDGDDDEGEEGWSAARGAIFLANLDDDAGRCPREMFPVVTPDDQLAACGDAFDEVVNGDDDLLDLARLVTVPWPAAPDDVEGTIAVAPAARARIFRREGGGFVQLAGALTAAELRAGVELAIEARDIVRDLAVWDGSVDVTLSVKRAGSARPPVVDRVRLRVAPVLIHHHLSPAEQVFVTRIENSARPAEDAASMLFRDALRAAVTAAGVPLPLFEHPMRDRWMQDLFETGWMSMPAPGGGQHAMRVALRSADVANPDGPAPLRVESRVVFWLRGKDWAAVQQYERDLPKAMQTLNNLGNTETIPPHGEYPLGRMLRGSVESFHPDRSFSRMLEAQGQQPPVYVDTSWLRVAHVDETLAFLPASTPRGWVLLVNDPTLAREMLLDARAAGHGDAKLFPGRQSRFGAPLETTVAQVLDDVDIMTRSAEAAAEIDGQLAVVRAATGLADDEIVRVPFLHHEANGKSTAYQPGTVNLLALSRTRVVAPDPLGPVIDGVDLFKQQLEEELGRLGIGVSWIDDWDLYHLNLGEVHCGTNATRAIPDVKWWETGR
jgi:protein-arginine deiminase